EIGPSTSSSRPRGGVEVTALLSRTRENRQMHAFDLARIGSGLVVSTFHDEIERALAEGAVVITAPPGTGKTTYVPPLVANALPGGRILVTQPRRVAVRAAARRIAQLDGSRLGGPSGFTVRGERVVSDETRIETVT